jgi:Zn-dependent protease with chaperone function
MTGGWLQLLWLVFVLMAGAWLLSALSVPVMIGGLVSGVRDPAARGRRILLTAALPWLVPVTVGAAVAATAGSKAIGWIADHCPHHGLGHPHLCFSHLPAVELGLLQGVLAGIVALLLVRGGAGLVWFQYRADREIGMLKALASSRGRLRIVSSRAPFALAGGVLAPVVLLSRGLLERLSFRQRRIVTAHEAAHLRHGDPWRNALFELLLILHLPAVRRRLRKPWLRSLEERADDAVARRFGAEDVVETLLHVARLELRKPAPGFSVADADLAGRARRLLDGECARRGGLPSFELAYALVLASLFAAAVMGHHALETLLGLVAGF